MLFLTLIISTTTTSSAICEEKVVESDHGRNQSQQGKSKSIYPVGDTHIQRCIRVGLGLFPLTLLNIDKCLDRNKQYLKLLLVSSCGEKHKFIYGKQNNLVANSVCLL